jgi:hypothetical protein
VIPIIAGLASGIALVALFDLLVTPSGTNVFVPEDRYGFQVSVYGVKNTYEAGEKIDFVMRIKGFGDTCASPNFAIRNVDTLEVIWYSKSVISVCDPTPKLVDVSLNQEDLSMGRAPLFINETGTYEFRASYTDSNIVRGSFDVKAAS